MSNNTSMQAHSIPIEASAASGMFQTSETPESDELEAAVAQIEKMCGHMMSEHFFVRIADLDAMAVACERYPRVLQWWEATIRMGNPEAPAVWAEVRARMDARATMLAIERVAANG